MKLFDGKYTNIDGVRTEVIGWDSLPYDSNPELPTSSRFEKLNHDHKPQKTPEELRKIRERRLNEQAN
jgi:hypothetical protein